MQLPFKLEPSAFIGGLGCEENVSPLIDGLWYTASAVGDGLEYRFAAGLLNGARYLTADLFLNGDDAGVFVLELQESENGPIFQFCYALLPGASARMRIPLDSVHMNRWLYEREGVWVKLRTSGQRVDLRRVDQMRIMVSMSAESVTRWCMTPVLATAAEPLKLAQPALPRGHLLDELGQTTLRHWSGKTDSSDEMVTRLRAQRRDASAQRWPEDFSKWGGWTARQFEATGYFRTQWDADADRWWLVDPDGFVFWSAGQDCVRPSIEANAAGLESALAWLPGPIDAEYALVVRRQDEAVYVDYLLANLMRAFGPNAWHTDWTDIVLGHLRQVGFNTVGNWSDWQIASAAGFPYVRPLSPPPDSSTLLIYRDLPDVFDPQFDVDATWFAEQLLDTRDDPALIGYFLMNEPTWSFAEETPAAGMLFNTITCASRLALADFLRERYGDNSSLSARWGIETTFEMIGESVWDTPLTEAARGDLTDFSAVMIERYFGTLSAACKAIDSNHLNLGVRYPSMPPDWCLNAMRSFDVFSMNCYRERVPTNVLQMVHEKLKLPTLIGEWHIGAMDAGLPACGVGPRVTDQAARGQAYRVYLENAAALPWCVGAHHFTLYDQSALGRFDGEAYQIGFLDICHRPYEVLVQAARQAHRQMYPVALGEQPPFNEEPEYLSRFFF